jgi:hypothetical protein
MVLDRPEIPLHTNGSGNDIRCHVTRPRPRGSQRAVTMPGSWRIADHLMDKL